MYTCTEVQLPVAVHRHAQSSRLFGCICRLCCKALYAHAHAFVCRTSAVASMPMLHGIACGKSWVKCMEAHARMFAHGCAWWMCMVIMHALCMVLHDTYVLRSGEYCAACSNAARLPACSASTAFEFTGRLQVSSDESRRPSISQTAARRPSSGGCHSVRGLHTRCGNPRADIWM